MGATTSLTGSSAISVEGCLVQAVPQTAGVRHGSFFILAQTPLPDMDTPNQQAWNRHPVFLRPQWLNHR